MQDLVSTINGFHSLVKIPELLKDCSSKLLKRLTQIEGGDFPNFEETIQFFKVSKKCEKKFFYFILNIFSFFSKYRPVSISTKHWKKV